MRLKKPKREPSYRPPNWLRPGRSWYQVYCGKALARSTILDPKGTRNVAPALTVAVQAPVGSSSSETRENVAVISRVEDVEGRQDPDWPEPQARAVHLVLDLLALGDRSMERARYPRRGRARPRRLPRRFARRAGASRARGPPQAEPPARAGVCGSTGDVGTSRAGSQGPRIFREYSSTRGPVTLGMARFK